MVAQTTPAPIRLEFDTPTPFVLDGESPAFFVYAGQTDEIITITLRATSDLDAQLNNPILEIWDIQGKRIAYNDNYPNETNPRDAQLKAIRLTETGDYLIRADTYGGVFAGEFEIIIIPSDPFEREGADNDMIFYLPRYAIFSETVIFDAGDVMTLTAQDLSGTLDPFLWITAPDGSILGENDDHPSADFTLGLLDSRITDLTITQTGDYQIHVRDFLGRAGHIRLMITQNDD
jgi:hypothetical protein